MANYIDGFILPIPRDGVETYQQAVKQIAEIFGLVTFPSKAVRDSANEKVAADPRMNALVGPLVESETPIFDASRMVFGGFRSISKLHT